MHYRSTDTALDSGSARPTHLASTVGFIFCLTHFLETM